VNLTPVRIVRRKGAFARKLTFVQWGSRSALGTWTLYIADLVIPGLREWWKKSLRPGAVVCFTRQLWRRTIAGLCLLRPQILPKTLDIELTVYAVWKPVWNFIFWSLLLKLSLRFYV